MANYVVMALQSCGRNHSAVALIGDSQPDRRQDIFMIYIYFLISPAPMPRPRALLCALSSDSIIKKPHWHTLPRKKWDATFREKQAVMGKRSVNLEIPGRRLPEPLPRRRRNRADFALCNNVYHNQFYKCRRFDRASEKITDERKIMITGGGIIWRRFRLKVSARRRR